MYVDCREDATLTTTYLEKGKACSSTYLEEQIVMVGEPGKYNLSHFSSTDAWGVFVDIGSYEKKWQSLALMVERNDWCS